MKGEREQRKGSTLLVIVLAILLVAAAGLVLVFAFRKLKTTDSMYTTVEHTNPQETITEDSLEAKVNEKTAQLESLENTLAEQQETIKNTKDVLENRVEYLKEMDMIEREFVVGGQNFYFVKSDYSLAAEENCISPEEAAQTAYDALKESFPDQDWDMSFCVQVYSTLELPFFYDEAEKLDVVWYIYDSVRRSDGHAAVNPYTGELISVYAPHAEPFYSKGGEFNNTLCLTMRDFFELSDDSAWVTWGMMLIRENGLDHGETVIRFDEKSGINRTRSGSVYASYYIGSGEEAEKIDISMDLLTHELTGYAMPSHMK